MVVMDFGIWELGFGFAKNWCVGNFVIAHRSNPNLSDHPIIRLLSLKFNRPEHYILT